MSDRDGSMTPAPHAVSDWSTAGALRAGDQDRNAAADLLGLALNEGRLNLAEYEERTSLAYRAVTCSELAALFTDLPAPAPLAVGRPAAARSAVVKAESDDWGDGVPGLFTGLPLVLKILWTIWLTGVLVNLVVWASVSAADGHLDYFWPIWVAGPAGAALLGLSAGATAIQRTHRGRDQ